MGPVEIILTDGSKCTVDEEDYPLLSRYKWHPNGKSKTYAVTNSNVFGDKNVLMHRLIMHPARNQVVDHVNGNGLDNRKQNLRCCTINENMWNVRSKNKHGYKGVFKRKNGTWSANIRHNGTRIYVGTFPSAKDAALAYDELAHRYFGEYALLNFPNELGTLQRRTCPHGVAIQRLKGERSTYCKLCMQDYFHQRHLVKVANKPPKAVQACPHGIPIRKAGYARTKYCMACRKEWRIERRSKNK